MQKQSKQINKKKLLLLVAMLVVYFFFMKSKDEIINYPKYINYSLFLLLFTTGFIYQLKCLKNTIVTKTKSLERILIIFLYVCKVLCLSWFITGICLIPFNYYNIYKSKKNTSEIIYCDIIGVSTYSKNRSVFYTFEGKTNILYGYIPIMEHMKEEYSNFQLIAHVRKGFLNTYILEDWNIKKK